MEEEKERKEVKHGRDSSGHHEVFKDSLRSSTALDADRSTGRGKTPQVLLSSHRKSEESKEERKAEHFVGKSFKTRSVTRRLREDSFCKRYGVMRSSSSI